MKYLFSFLLAFLLSPGVLGAELSEENVLKFIENVDSSFIRQDSTAIESFLSDDAIVTGTVTVSGNVSNFDIGKEQYLSSVSEGWKTYSSYQYTKERSVVRSVSENSAVVDEVVTEVFEINGISYEVRSVNEVFIESVNGVVKVTKVVINSTVTEK